MTLSPEPEEKKVARQGQKTKKKQLHWKLADPNSSSIPTKEKGKEQKKAKEKKQRIPKVQQWVPK
jgi:hypothetical protein